MGPITQSLRLAFRPAHVRQADDLEATFASIKKQADGIVIIDDGLFIANAGNGGTSQLKLASIDGDTSTFLANVESRVEYSAGWLTPSTSPISGGNRWSW